MKKRTFRGDGAHLGIKASRALMAIRGVKESPSPDERMGDQEFEEWIRGAPTFFENVDYDETCRRLAKLYLCLLEEGELASEPRKLREAFQRRFPEQAWVASFMTSFMHGWAFNVARKIVGLEPAPNPALSKQSQPSRRSLNVRAGKENS